MKTEPDPKAVEQVETTSLSVVSAASAIVIEDDPSLSHATDFVRSLKDVRKQIDATFDPVVKAAHAAHKVAIAAKKKHEQPILEAERTVKAAIVSYTDEQAEIRRLALAAENAEKARLAKAAEDERQRREAAKQFPAANAPPPPPPAPSAPPPPSLVPAAPAAPVVKGLSTRTKHVAEVVDLDALIRAVAAGKAPSSLLKVDAVELRKYAVATRGTMNVDGVVFSTKTEAAVR